MKGNGERTQKSSCNDNQKNVYCLYFFHCMQAAESSIVFSRTCNDMSFRWFVIGEETQRYRKRFCIMRRT